ncbi:hypothetical protein HELRODRAFT_63814, partial [Helobdella robusta]|uniref:Tubulin--tyrosine ligase-like protein 5 n=1 Tax=Helobdella robusta TaxID=6412 RepID=T1FXK7_HELRO
KNLRSKSSSPAIFWSGRSKKVPIFLFKADALGCNFTEHKSIANKYHMSFKQPKGDCKLVRTLLTCHGFKECEASSVNYNIIWTGSHVKPYFLSSMLKFQKVNHFPRSYEITRKDRLYKNIEMMQQNKGFKHFNFVPQTFVLPREYKAFLFHSNKEKCLWIVKPTSLSRGRGIFLTNSPEKALVDDNVVVCRYIDNPLLINGYKFDLRLYVLVTSFDPLIIYLYKEGLTRFATVQFNKSSKFMGDSCMHLTNYSINKHSSAYVSNNDASVEDRGSKWSLSGLLRFLRENHYDTTALMMSIEDVIIKTMISGEFAISAACKAFVPHRGNCFELFGFDILIDEKMKPWVLEVNLSPSLACDAPLDLKIKSNMISDLLSLVGS